MKALRILIILGIIVSFSVNSNAQRANLKNRIGLYFKQFDGRVTHQSVNKLISSLKLVSSKQANMCFVSIADYNDCQDKADVVYKDLSVYLDDLISKEVTVTEVSAMKYWEDENYFTLSYRLSYVNDNPDYPTDVNFDTIDLGIEGDRIKDIIHSREWFGLSEYVKK